MKVLIINAGSSSLKYQLMDMKDESVIAKGNCERIGVDGKMGYKTGAGYAVEYEADFPTHKEALSEVVKLLTTGESKVIEDLKEISAIGHRMLHGQEVYKESAIATDKLLQDMLDWQELGPLHIPPQAGAIVTCKEIFGTDVPQVAVFDTSFHQTMPPKAYMFGIPYEYYEKYTIRRYGFHGTSHRYLTLRYSELTGDLQGKKIITCHLGNGSSISAVKDGKCADTSMGFTPLDGFIMGTRSGAVDPSVVTFIQNKENLSADEITDIMNKKSGFLGISGVSSDCRDVEAAAAEGNERAKLTMDMLVYQIKKFVGSYAAAMGGVDAVIFTGGIGENDATVRAEVCSGMEFLGLSIDKEACNNASRKEMKFSTADSKVEAWVIPTDEELMIARDTRDLVEK
jgi:acetate kinase